MINNLPWHGNLRGSSKPRSIVRLDGNDVFFSNWNVNLNSTHQADDFQLELPFRTGRDIPQGYLVNTPDYVSYLFTNPQVLVEIFVGYPSGATYQASDLTRIMYGYMDTAELNFSDQKESVLLSGRNMIAPFIDNKTTEKYQNMTSSAIAIMLAQRRGLQYSVTPTYELTGKYYNGDNTSLNKDASEWDLLTFLAEQEGFELRVKDNTLYFGPFSTVVGAVTSSAPLPYTWGQNIVSLTLSKSPHASKDIIVEVHSYNSAKKQHIVAKSVKAYKQSNLQSYTERYFYPGLTQDQAQKKADSLRDQLSRLESVGTLSVSGNEQLTVDNQIQLYGVGLELSQNYFIRKAVHRFDHVTPNGYTSEITFSNLLLPDEQTGGI